MDASYIVPFVNSVKNVFGMMLQMDVQIGKPAPKSSSSPSYDVSGIIGMSGDVEGNIVLSFPTEVSEKLVSKFTGMELTTDHEDFADAIGELVNMVSGSAKAEFTGKRVSISCPSVVVGSDHLVTSSKDMVCITIPCKTEFGEFGVEVAMKQSSIEQAGGDTQAASA